MTDATFEKIVLMLVAMLRLFKGRVDCCISKPKLA
jgi:hypothetical protein